MPELFDSKRNTLLVLAAGASVGFLAAIIAATCDKPARNSTRPAVRGAADEIPRGYGEQHVGESHVGAKGRTA